jgi:hypothetical protein
VYEYVEGRQEGASAELNRFVDCFNAQSMLQRSSSAVNRRSFFPPYWPADLVGLGCSDRYAWAFYGAVLTSLLSHVGLFLVLSAGNGVGNGVRLLEFSSNNLLVY